MKGESCASIFLFLVVLVGTNGSPLEVQENEPEPVEAPIAPPPIAKMTSLQVEESMRKIIKQAKEMNDSEVVSTMKNMQNPGIIDRTVQVNFLNTLFLMANSSAITGARVSRAAGTLIRGFVQDSFNIGSIGAYLPRLIFLDGPTQFIELLRLYRSNQLQVPRDVDEAMDTLINFADIVRNGPIGTNLNTSFLHFFPNIFRGIELLNTEVIYGVFSWFGPVGPSDVSGGALEGLWNRWDVKSSTSHRPTYDLLTKPPHFTN